MVGKAFKVVKLGNKFANSIDGCCDKVSVGFDKVPPVEVKITGSKSLCSNATKTPQQRGRDMETAILKGMGIPKNKTKVPGIEGNSVPDFITDTTVGEIKNTKRVTDSKQLRIQREFARQEGKTHVVVTGMNTPVSKTVQRESKVIRKPELDVN